jgi:hypothetical protein
VQLARHRVRARGICRTGNEQTTHLSGQAGPGTAPFQQVHALRLCQSRGVVVCLREWLIQEGRIAHEDVLGCVELGCHAELVDVRFETVGGREHETDAQDGNG